MRFFQSRDFTRGKHPPVSRFECADIEWPDSDADEASDLVAELVAHNSNLAFESLLEGDANLRWGSDFKSSGAG
jgi:hypothetical protein